MVKKQKKEKIITNREKMETMGNREYARNLIYYNESDDKLYFCGEDTETYGHETLEEAIIACIKWLERPAEK